MTAGGFDPLEPPLEIGTRVVDSAQPQISPIGGPWLQLELLVAFALHERGVARLQQVEHGRNVPGVVAKLERRTRARRELAEKGLERRNVAARMRRQLDEQRAETRTKIRDRRQQKLELSSRSRAAV